MVSPPLPDELPRIVTLLAGHLRVYAFKECLMRESAYFRALFERQPHGKEFYLPCKADVLQLIVEFCQSQQFPLLYTHRDGFDDTMYLRLAAAAKLFKVDKLAAWIKAKRYIDVVHKSSTATMVDCAEEMVEAQLANCAAQSGRPHGDVSLGQGASSGITHVFHCRFTDKQRVDPGDGVRGDGSVEQAVYRDVHRDQLLVVRETITIKHELLSAAALDEEA